MSPSSKSKSKDKKAANDAQKTPSKASGSMSVNTGVPASAYNPLLGTFQTIESLSTTGSLSLHSNGRFRNIDESDSTGADCDSVSNNGSWSGDSEDHKEKASNPPARQEMIPGADNDKREKIRLKNERKHQRQREKRAQELHERCSQYLMSRKLEVLAQQLVAMGISQERATLALMLNEGKIEESIHWLFDDDGAKEAEHQMDSAPGNLKIDISEELGRISDLEVRYKCTKQEVERAVVAAEGDIERAEETLRRQNKDQSSASQKLEETTDHPTVSNNKLTIRHASQNSVAQTPPKADLYPAGQGTRDRKDFDYSRGSSVIGGPSGSANQNLHPLDRIQMKLEWMKLQQNAVLGEKMWSSMGSNTPMLYPQPSPPPMKTEAPHVAFGNEFRKLQQQEIGEPVMVMQRSQSMNVKQLPVTSMSSSLPGTANGFMPNVAAARSQTPNDLNSNPMYKQLQYPRHQGQVNGHRSRTAASPTLAAASSLGLFSGFGSTATPGSTPSPLDWNTGGSMGQLDYTSIDWSLDRSLSWPRSNRQFPVSATSAYDSNINGYNNKPGMRITANGIRIGFAGMQEVGVGAGDSSSSLGSSRDWTSPFEGKDLFSLSRQFVSSPSL